MIAILPWVDIYDIVRVEVGEQIAFYLYNIISFQQELCCFIHQYVLLST